MEFQRALELMQIEKACAIRNSVGCCDRNCEKCDLAQEDTDVIEAYQMAVFALKRLIAENGKYCPTCKRCSDNRESGTDCPIETHYALPLDGYCHLYEPVSDCRTCVQDCQFIGCDMPQTKLCHGYKPAEQPQKEGEDHEVL